MRPWSLGPACLLIGCTASPAPLPAPGSLGIHIRWPARQAQILPLSTQLIRLKVAQGSRILFDLDLSRPGGDDLSPASQASLQLEAASGLTVQASAYRHDPPSEGEAPVAFGSCGDVTIHANERTAVTLTMIPATGPTLLAFQPSNGGPGTPLLLTGRFGAQGPFTLTLGVVSGAAAASGSNLVAHVPLGATTGTVTVSADGVPSAEGGLFRVLTRLDLGPASASLEVGQSAPFSVPTARDSTNVTVRDPTLTRWEVVPSGPSLPDQTSPVGQVESDGRFTALATGSAWLRVWSGQLAATAAITVH